jgi:hypothetical protein
MDLKNLLYAEIEHMGSLLIKQKLKEKNENSKYIIEELMKNCLNSLNGSKLPDANWVSLAEALMHYMLTVMVLPSQRKIIVGDIEVSIIIPNIRNINKNLSQILIIQFCNNDFSIKKLVKRLKAIQPNEQNVWLVSYLPLDLAVPFRNYVISDPILEKDEMILPFSQIIMDVVYYIDKINYTGFKIL